MKKQLTLSLLTMMTLSGCLSMDDLSGKNSSANNNTATAANALSTIQFELPPQVQWSSSEENNGSATVFVPQGLSLQDSPIRVVYQKSMTSQPAKALADLMVEPLQNNCEKTSITNLNNQSRYPNKVNYKTLCNKVKMGEFGIISYVSVFSDGRNSHLLLSEVKTPVLNDKGQFSIPNTEEGRQTAKITAGMVKATEKMMSDVLACDSTNICQ